MIDYLQIGVVSVFCWLWTTKLTEVDMIFSWVPGLVDNNLPESFKHPLYYCSTCVCGFWYGSYLLSSVIQYNTSIGIAANSLVLAMGLTEIITRKLQ